MNTDIVFKLPSALCRGDEYSLGDKLPVTICGRPYEAIVHSISMLPEDGDAVRIGANWTADTVKTFDGIDWDRLPNEYNFIAMDENGVWYAYINKPVLDYHPQDGGFWVSHETTPYNLERARKLPNLGMYLLGWEESLQQRPKS